MSRIKTIILTTKAHFPMLNAPHSIVECRFEQGSFTYTTNLSHKDPAYFAAPLSSLRESRTFTFLPGVFDQAFATISTYAETALQHPEAFTLTDGPEDTLQVFYENGIHEELRKNCFLIDPTLLEEALRGLLPPPVLHDIFHRVVAVDNEINAGGRDC